MPNEKTIMRKNEPPHARNAGVTAPGVTENVLAAKLDQINWLGPTIICIAVIAAYFVAPAMPPLLDEQFFIKWTAAAGGPDAPFSQYMMWSGFSPADLWGPLTALVNKLSQWLSFGAVPVLRFQGIFLHAITCTLFYFSARRLWRAAGGTPLVPLAAAVLFAAYPINAETVAWLGGRGLELGGMFFIASVFCYLKARDIGAANPAEEREQANEFNWVWMLNSVLAFALSLLSSTVAWSGCLFYPALELWLLGPGRNSNTNAAGGRAKLDPTIRMIGPLLFIVLTGAYVAATGAIWHLTSFEVRPDLSLPAIGKTLRALVFPINEAIWHKYAIQYDLLYVLYPPFLLMFVWSLRTSRTMRSLTVLYAAWFVMALFPELGRIARDNLHGSRLFYLAAMPLCGLMAAILCGCGSAFKRWQTATGIVSALAVSFLTIFFLAHITNQNLAWRNGGRQIAAVQKSLGVVAAKTGAPYLMASEIPEWVSVSPRFSTSGLVVFDAKSRLLAASAVSPGRLKDALSAGKYRETALTWNEDLRSFIPLGVDGISDPPKVLDAKQIAARFSPPLEFVHNAHLDAVDNTLVIDSNNDRGPVMRLSTAGLTPLTDDFIYVDCRIEAPPSAEKPLVEFYWQTGTHPDYNNKTRRVWTRAFVDGTYHRYYLPLRTIGWIDSGPLLTMTFGFPAGAKVTIRQMGVNTRNEISPEFDVVSQTDNSTGSRFDPPYYNFPTLPDLGLYQVPENAPLTVSHNSSKVEGATGVAIEISMPDKNFPNPSGNEPSGVGGKTVGINGIQGTYELSTNEFPRTGVYSLRAQAINERHEPIGQFSDAVYCLVRRPVRSGWVEQLQ